MLVKKQKLVSVELPAFVCMNHYFDRLLISSKHMRILYKLDIKSHKTVSTEKDMNNLFNYRYMYLKTYAKFTFCTKSQGHVSDENFLYCSPS